MFKASIAEAAVGSCGLKVLGASRGCNPRTLLVREAVQLKKESFRDMTSTEEVIGRWIEHLFSLW